MRRTSPPYFLRKEWKVDFRPDWLLGIGCPHGGFRGTICQVYHATIAGAAVQPEVKLNGDVNGFFYVDKKPGNYEIMTSSEVDRKLSLTLDPGQTRFVRLNLAIGFLSGHVYLELVDLDEATKDIEDCRFTGKEIWGVFLKGKRGVLSCLVTIMA